jgi:hypothetical protein
MLIFFTLQACETVRSLAVLEENRRGLKVKGACEAVVAALKKHGDSSAGVAEQVRNL